MTFFRRQSLAILAAASLMAGSAWAQGGLSQFENMNLKVNKFSDGREPTMDFSLAPDGSFDSFTAVGGPVELKTDEYDLSAGRLVYDAAGELLEATGNVVIRQQGLEATSGQATFNLATGGVVLRGNPDVRQLTGENTAHFAGMEIFNLRRSANGSMEVVLTGKEAIRIDIESKGQPGSGSAGNLTSLGETIQITTSPRRDFSPRVTAQLGPEGDLSEFRAQGSVNLQSPSVRMVCEELIYDGRRVEALRNVYIKRDAIEADCGRMLYDLSTGNIDLTIQPDVRQRQPNRVARLYGMEVFEIRPRPDGGTDTQVRGGVPQIQYLPLPETMTPGVTGSTSPSPSRSGREISPSDAGSLPR